MSDDHVWVLPPELTSTQAAAAVVRLVDDLARAIDPARPPLAEPVRGASTTEGDSQGGTTTRWTTSYGGVEQRESVFEIFDGTTPRSYGCRVVALGLPADAEVSLWLSHQVPTHLQDSRCGGTVRGTAESAARLDWTLSTVVWPTTR